ncbi:MAG: dihydrolipoyl dehydrogenase [Candidatus Omnitrophota bacterium]
MKKKLIIIGAGPGGYTAAFHAADHGLDVTLIDQDARMGGVCLNRGCIPSKTFLHIARIISETKTVKEIGVAFGEPLIDIKRIQDYKNNVVSKLTHGLSMLAKQRGVTWIQGRASFLSSDLLAVFKTGGGHEEIPFETAVLATGSMPVGLPFAPASDKIWSSTDALDLPMLPERLLIIGGGYIGMELATVYGALGSRITIVEMTPALLPGVDHDLSMILLKHARTLFSSIKLSTRVIAINENNAGLQVTFESKDGGRADETFDRVLVAAGRKNIFDGLGLVNTSVKLTGDGKFIAVDQKRMTTDKKIYAIGDITSGPMLAHKASAEAKVAVDAILGKETSFQPKAIPGVVFTDPEIAWCGLTETDVKEKNIPAIISKFPWAASGRALTIERPEGITKIIADPDSHKVLGVGIAGAGAGELIAEAVTAVEKELRAEDLASSIHPHPTLSETIMEAAEGIFGQSTHIYRKK